MASEINRVSDEGASDAQVYVYLAGRYRNNMHILEHRQVSTVGTVLRCRRDAKDASGPLDTMKIDHFSLLFH